MKRALGFASSTIAISTIFLLILLVPNQAIAGGGPPPPGTPGTGMVGDFRCWNIEGVVPEVSTVVLEDQFGRMEVQIFEPLELCAAADKSFEEFDFRNPNGFGHHLKCYRIEGSLETPRTVEVIDQFHKEVVTLQRVVELCIPAVKQIGPLVDGETVDILSGPQHHFKCYDISNEPAVNFPIFITDQFGSDSPIVVQPILFCNPVIKNNEGDREQILNQKEHWKCYLIQNRITQPLDLLVSLFDQFNPFIIDDQNPQFPGGEQHILQLPEKICVEAHKMPVRVGGEIMPLDTTSLLLTGAQMNAAWMIPVIVSAIGIGIVIARKF